MKKATRKRECVKKMEGISRHLQVQSRLPTKHWLKAMIKDEREASKTYKQYGFPKLAKDERHHRHVLQKALGKVV